MTTIKRGSKIPLEIWIQAHIQWIPLLVLRVVFILVGIIISPVVLALIKRQRYNAFGEIDCKYNFDRYPGGSKLGWEFISIPPSWANGNKFEKFIWLFGNDEDGFLGDRYGKWSANCDAKERKLINKFKWGFLRNPCNNLSRYTKTFSVKTTDLTKVEFWGKYNKDDGGSMVRATDKSGRVYYGYCNEKKGNRMMGFKVYARHGDTPENVDDQDRGFTYRF